MPIIKPVRNIHPHIPEDCFVAENATIVGEVTMGNHCSVWFNRQQPLATMFPLVIMPLYMVVPSTTMCLLVWEVL